MLAAAARNRRRALTAAACAALSALVCGVALSASAAPGITGDDTITTIAGGGTSVADGVPATSALFRPSPYGSTGMSIAVDAHDNLYVADIGNQRVREVSAADGKIRTIAGTGVRGYSGDGGKATAAELFNPHGVAVDGQGDVYFGDGGASYGQIVRKITPAGIISTVAGGAAPSNPANGDGGPATSAYLGVSALALDGKGNLYIADGGGNGRVRKVSPGGTITTLAGGGTQDRNGIPATQAQLSFPSGVAVDSQGNVYIAEFNPNRVRKVSPDGTISLFAGNGTVGASGDGGPATAAALTQPTALAVDLQRNVYIVSAGVRKVDPAGTITTITNGSGQALGDGGPARAASLRADSVAVDPQGANLYIFDFRNDRVRKVAQAPTVKGSPSTTATAALAHAFEVDLVQMAGARTTLKNALGAASSCSLSAHAAAARVQAVALARRHVLAQLAGLGTPTPLAVRLKALLQAALNHSIAADLHYRDWLSRQRARCSRTPTPGTTAAQREDRMATAAKQSFLAAFNPLARQLHLHTWSADQI